MGKYQQKNRPKLGKNGQKLVKIDNNSKKWASMTKNLGKIGENQAKMVVKFFFTQKM